MNKISVIFVSLLSICVPTHASHVHWDTTKLVYTLPVFVQNLKDEVVVSINEKGQIEINVPQKDPAYWLTPKDTHSDKIIASFFADVDFTKATPEHFKTLLNCVKTEYPHLKGLYESSAYITETHTLEEHTLAVLEQFNKQKEFYSYLNAPCYKNITKNIHNLLVAAILVHDIGKPLGIRKKQHEHTLPIAKNALTRWGLTSKEIELVLTLIDNDIVGELVQPRYKKKTIEAHDELLKLATKVGLSLKDYFVLQSLFYVSDASSYPFIRSISFKKAVTSHYLYPTSKKYWDLFYTIHQTPYYQKLLSIITSA